MKPARDSALRANGARGGVVRRSLALVAGILVAAALVVGSALALRTSTTAPAPTSEAARLASLTTTGVVHHYEYVLPDGAMYVYDMDHGQRLVAHYALPGTEGIRGVVASPAQSRLFVSYGSDSTGPGSLLAYDLQTNQIVWRQTYPFGVDSMAITPDGRRIYMPVGEASPSSTWHILDAASGAVIGTVQGGSGPHNTIVSLDGRRAYLGGRNANRLLVVSTTTNRVIRRIGPLLTGVRPFTIDGRQRFAFTTATGFLGFQVSSIRTGRVLFTVRVPGFGWDPATFPLSTPSHGISLSPDERQLWLIDTANNDVHVFDVRGLPKRRPQMVASIALNPQIVGDRSPCSFDLCARFGWLQHSLDRRFVYVGDSGDVIDTRTRRVVAVLPALQESRQMIEIDWRGGVPVATSSRIGIGHVTH